MHGPHIIGFFLEKEYHTKFFKEIFKKRVHFRDKKSNCFLKLEKAFLDIYWHHFFLEKWKCVGTVGFKFKNCNLYFSRENDFNVGIFEPK